MPNGKKKLLISSTTASWLAICPRASNWHFETIYSLATPNVQFLITYQTDSPEREANITPLHANIAQVPRLYHLQSNIVYNIMYITSNQRSEASKISLQWLHTTIQIYNVHVTVPDRNLILFCWLFRKHCIWRSVSLSFHSIIGSAHMCHVNVSISDTSMKSVWALPLTEAWRYFDHITMAILCFDHITLAIQYNLGDTVLWSYNLGNTV